jgi:hypothetical protein
VARGCRRRAHSHGSAARLLATVSEQGRSSQPAGRVIFDGAVMHIVIDGDPRTVCGEWGAEEFPEATDLSVALCKDCESGTTWRQPWAERLGVH